MSLADPVEAKSVMQIKTQNTSLQQRFLVNIALVNRSFSFPFLLRNYNSEVVRRKDVIRRIGALKVDIEKQEDESMNLKNMGGAHLRSGLNMWYLSSLRVSTLPRNTARGKTRLAIQAAANFLEYTKKKDDRSDTQDGGQSSLLKFESPCHRWLESFL